MAVCVIRYFEVCRCGEVEDVIFVPLLVNTILYLDLLFCHQVSDELPEDGRSTVWGELVEELNLPHRELYINPDQEVFGVFPIYHITRSVFAAWNCIMFNTRYCRKASRSELRILQCLPTRIPFIFPLCNHLYTTSRFTRSRSATSDGVNKSSPMQGSMMDIIFNPI